MFKPTYLYIKEHTETKLKYFGKTTLSDPVKYLGSGKYWLNHIEKHGKDKVTTTWYHLFTDQNELTNFAIKFSKDNNITESDDWANLCDENGLSGGYRQNNHLRILNSFPQTEESKQKRSKALKGKPSPKIGIPQTDIARKNMSKPKRRICRLFDKQEMSVNQFTIWSKSLD